MCCVQVWMKLIYNAKPQFCTQVHMKHTEYIYTAMYMTKFHLLTKAAFT